MNKLMSRLRRWFHSQKTSLQAKFVKLRQLFGPTSNQVHNRNGPTVWVIFKDSPSLTVIIWSAVRQHNVRSRDRPDIFIEDLKSAVRYVTTIITLILIIMRILILLKQIIWINF